MDAIEHLYDAVFDVDPDDGFVYDEEVKPGAPDLFIWHPDPSLRLWFFAEVKGPTDHLRRTQFHWLHRHWDDIQGRAMLLIVGR